MILKSIELNNFRNYKKLKLAFYKGINIIYGNNAQGKTNLLESIYVLGLTKSHRNYIDSNLINYQSKKLNIKGKINSNKLDNSLEIYIDNKIKKLYVNNKNIKRISDYISIMNIIIFYPEDLELIKGSPINRRNYLNLELSQLYSNYYIILNEYNKLLKMRNEYLKNEKIDKAYLKIITKYLIEKSIVIYKTREKYVEKLNQQAANIYKNIMGIDNFYIKYKKNIELDLNDENLESELLEKYNQKEYNDIKFSNTTIGPHKDDLEFYIGNNNLKHYGSQGQQRIAVLALKLSEIDIFKKYKETTPILLLDDIFSELDDNKKNNLLKYINKDVQTIITTTELTNIDKKLIKKSKLFKIESGKVLKIKEVKDNE